MNNNFSETYAAWPVRTYIINGEGKMAWIWEPHFPGYYEFDEIPPAINAALQANKQNPIRFRSPSQAFQPTRYNIQLV